MIDAVRLSKAIASVEDLLTIRLQKDLTDTEVYSKDFVGHSQRIERATDMNPQSAPRVLTSSEPRQHAMTSWSAQRGEADSVERPSPGPMAGTSTTSGDFAAEVLEKSVQQVLAAIQRPMPAMPTFTGESRKELDIFMRRFNGYLEDNKIDPSEKLEILITAYTGTGVLKKALISHTQLDPETGYKKAVNMLQEWLGNAQDEMDETIRDLLEGPPIRDTDTKGLQAFITNLKITVIYLDTAGRRIDLDSFGVITVLAGRLTGQLRERYENKLHNFKRKYDTRPGIEWFILQLEKSSRTLRVSEESECTDKT